MKYRESQVNKEALVNRLLRRSENSNKHDFGHALLVCGCERMPGAAVLATGAALRSGCGLVTLRSTATARAAAMTACPSAMLSTEEEDVITDIPCDFDRYDAIGIGPGLGKDPRTVEALSRFLLAAKKEGIRLVLDADALNIISEHRDLLDLIPGQSVLTPHMGELRRLLGEDIPTAKDIISLCEHTESAIIVKGHHTRVFVHTGDLYVNTTGNAGLAKGGSGDVLTGLITGLLARGYLWYEAAILGVWLHGYAGDCLTFERTAECYSSHDLLDYLYKGFLELYHEQSKYCIKNSESF